ncbi:hypothetical protein MWH28_04340 [Natroniella sulfidigena]|uniref:hypothetical protein n=1 Tax=Natroniella sulfidigena TaxID=723921 RepID=UPI00200ACC69|nr:hypothetical protein [Natroniella sulfidigena]MCK8816598.1 hypothetical protein [Natroniella sulfidigena]
MKELGDNMEELGEKITQLGFRIIPYSFSFYFLIRWLEYIWKKGYSSLVKSIWYFALGCMYLYNMVKIDQVVMYICFMEAWDLFFQQLELNNKRKENSFELKK